MAMNKPARAYLRAVRRALRCPGRQGKRLLRQLSEDIEEYCEEHPDATEEALCRRFGAPEDVAADFAEDLGGSIAVNIQRRRNRIVTAVIVVRWVESITYEADEPLEEPDEIYWSVTFTSPPETEELNP